jgi:hypothetical protein
VPAELVDVLPPDVSPGVLRQETLPLTDGDDADDGARGARVKRNKTSVRVWPGDGAKSIPVSLQWLQRRRPNEAADDLLDFAASEAERWLAEPNDFYKGKPQKLYGHLHLALTPKRFPDGGAIDRFADFKAGRAAPANGSSAASGRGKSTGRASIAELMADVIHIQGV